MPFPYASNNPLYNSDPTGLIIESDERGEALIQELSKTEEGKALVDYLASSELTYSIVAAAEAPASLPETAVGVAGNAPGETSYEGTIAGASNTQSKPVAGMAVRLFDSRVKALGVDPVGNLAHELGHAAMWDIARTGSAKYPEFLEPFLKYTTPGRENGIEDMFVHNFLYSNAAADIPRRSCCR